MSHALPAGVQVLERGWLSANTVVCGGEQPALVDSGYYTHAPQTLALVDAALGGAAPALLVNTHLHSDHCGGNAALQSRYPALRTLIPAGQAAHVQTWNAEALSYTPTGQQCPSFRMDGTLRPGSSLQLGDLDWEVHAAPGHDPHSVVLFEPQSRTLISADALWENGFGVVFPEIEGVGAFKEVADTLDLIERLAPQTVIPGHGPVFAYSADVLGRARSRLDSFVKSPLRHAQHAAKVLLKFKLLEVQAQDYAEFERWALSTPFLALLHQRYFADASPQQWLKALITDLEKAKAARLEAGRLLNS